ncbi:MAG: hypothetical protein H6Q59_418 [Firmicutes bacterium]|nr:hypothetical protein [Bacillota bacterium]
MVELKIKISEIDYGAAMDSLLPVIIQHVSEGENAGFFAKMLGKNNAIAGVMAKAALAALPQNKKDEIAVAIIEKYHDEITKGLVEFARNKGISFQLDEMQVSAKE